MESQIGIPEWQIIGEPGLGTISFQDSVLDTPSVNTRAGLYIYINALLHNRPNFDDAPVVTFLNTRYKEDVPGLVSDLILAVFDVLANATYRNESSRSINILRSFLVNKLPPFLHTHYAALIFEPLTVEQCIRQAFGRVDPSAFPSFSQMFDFSSNSGNSALSEARQEFLFACALHQLIQEQSIEEILGDVPMQSLPAGGKYSKDDLVNQCTFNPSKIDQFVSELENMEGNAGEIANAVIEILHTLCANNDTVTLKGVCQTICRRPVALDIMMLFTSPIKLLRPLCQVLDNWQDHDDQGEYQPVYDEFGSILLFVVVVKARFTLAIEELGFDVQDSWVQQYLRASPISRPLSDLSEHESEILGAWIKGLFEAEVISDELMSMSKPKEFHLQVTTLFDQSIKARQSGVLSFEKLKGGFDFLLEPFLLPSLVAGLIWFARRAYEVSRQQNKLDIMLPALQALIKPATMSHDSSAIHGAVMSIVARPLKDALNQIKKDQPSRTDLNRLIETLNPHYDERPGYSALKELSSWSVTPGGGLQAALRNTLNSLVVWSANSNSSSEMSPPSYSHGQIEETIKILGAKRVFDMLVQEVLLQTPGSTNQEILLDCVAVMIVACESNSGSSSSDQDFHNENLNHHQRKIPSVPLHLYDILHLTFQDVNELSQTDVARATLIVRLHRRVNAFLGRKPEDDINAAGGVGGDGVDTTAAQQHAAADDFMANVVAGAAAAVGVGPDGEDFGATAHIDDVIAQAQNEGVGVDHQGFLTGDGGGDDGSLLGLA